MGGALQALADSQEAVIVEAVGFLASVTHAGQLRKRSLLAAISKVCTLALHSAPVSRHGCASM